MDHPETSPHHPKTPRAPHSSPKPWAPAFAAMMMVLVLVLLKVVFDQRSDPAAVDASPGQAAAAGPEFCDGTGDAERQRLLRGWALMGRTVEGATLADLLVDQGVCLGVESLAYNCGYARPAKTWFGGGWSKSVVVFGAECLQIASDDVVAAILVHEAEHIRRAVDGEACGRSCTVLDNGIRLEEEIAAHAAEARWWIGVYGAGGRYAWSGYNYSIDDLAAAYRRGPDAFAAFVRGFRSDAREGSGS